MPQVQPSEGSVLEGAVVEVEIEAVYVNIGKRWGAVDLSQTKTETAIKAVSALPAKRQEQYMNPTLAGNSCRPRGAFNQAG